MQGSCWALSSENESLFLKEIYGTGNRTEKFKEAFKMDYVHEVFEGANFNGQEA